MNYTLQIDLLGGEKVEGILQRLSGLTGALGQGGSKSPAAAVSNDLNKATSSAGALNQQLKGVADTLNKIRKGDDLGGQGILKNLRALKPDSPGFKQLWGMATQAEKDAFNGVSSGGTGSAASKFKGVLWNSKEMLGTPRLPDVSKFLPKDSDKSFTPPESAGRKYKSFGQALAAIQSLGDISQFDKSFTPPESAGRKYKSMGQALAAVQALGDISQFDKKSQWGKIFLGAATMGFNPWIGSRILSDAVKGGGGGGKGGNVATGIFGAGGAMGFAEFYLAANVFKWAVRKFGEIVDSGAQRYSAALKSGMGLQFTTRRDLLAQIMGVSENDVFRFGAQIAYLNPKLQYASSVLAKTAIPLTAVSWNFKVLETDLAALGSTLVTQLAPGINGGIILLQKLTNVFDKMAESRIFKILSFSPALWALDKLGGGSSDINKLPPPQSWMKQLPASQWEHMGLVVGGGSNNYAKQTASHTREIMKYTAVIAKFVAGGGTFGGGGAGGSWGMSPNTSNP